MNDTTERSADNEKVDEPDGQYQATFGDASRTIDSNRRSAAWSVNAVLNGGNWMIGRRISEFEQSVERRADYGDWIVERLATEFSAHCGRGFSTCNFRKMKAFCLACPIVQTTSAQSESGGNQQGVSAESSLVRLGACRRTPILGNRHTTY